MNAALKQITPSAVLLAATTLILAEGGTTNLMVKQFLRNRGYQVHQSEVSRWLFTIALEKGCGISHNGLFRVFYFPAPRASLQ